MVNNFETKNKGFFKVLYGHVLFNSGKKPSDAEMDVLVDETLL